VQHRNLLSLFWPNYLWNYLFKTAALPLMHYAHCYLLACKPVQIQRFWGTLISRGAISNALYIHTGPKMQLSLGFVYLLLSEQDFVSRKSVFIFMSVALNCWTTRYSALPISSTVSWNTRRSLRSSSSLTAVWLHSSTVSLGWRVTTVRRPLSRTRLKFSLNIHISDIFGHHVSNNVDIFLWLNMVHLLWIILLFIYCEYFRNTLWTHV